MSQVLPLTARVELVAPEPDYRAFKGISDFVVALLADPRRHLSREEVAVAGALEKLGLRTLGVEESDTKRPDAVTVDLLHRLEFKRSTIGSPERTQKEIRRGSLKSRRVIADLRGASLDTAAAIQCLQRMIGSPLGSRLDEVGLLLRGDVLVGWSRYE